MTDAFDDIQTIHRKEDGEQVTERHVTVEDATGEEYIHRFEIHDDGKRQYLDEGTPPESALDKLEQFDAASETNE